MWAAPEVFDSNRRYSESCDVFSYAVLCVEIDTRDRPYKQDGE